jgi:hypothetical protein
MAWLNLYLVDPVDPGKETLCPLRVSVVQSAFLSPSPFRAFAFSLSSRRMGNIKGSGGLKSAEESD